MNKIELNKLFCKYNYRVSCLHFGLKISLILSSICFPIFWKQLYNFYNFNENVSLIVRRNIVAIFLMIIYLLIPAVFYFFPTTMQKIFFMNFGICMKVSYSTFDLVKVPGIDYTDLVSHGWYTEHAKEYLLLRVIACQYWVINVFVLLYRFEVLGIP